MGRTTSFACAMALFAMGAQSTLLTLSAVEMITSFTIPLSCIFAYNTPINGCELSDFTAGYCSQSCQQSLMRVQTNIQASCDFVDAQPNSLIWEAQRGNLVNAICNTQPTTTTVRIRPTSVPASPSLTLVTPSPSSTKASFTQLTPTAGSSTTEESSTTTQATTSPTSSDSSTDTDASSTTSESTSARTTEQTSTSIGKTSTTTLSTSTKPTRNPEAGAGDPFANTPNSSSKMGSCVWSFIMILFVMGLM